MKLKTFKKSHVVGIGAIACVVFIISLLFIFAERALEVVLIRAGLPQSRIGHIDFGINGTVLTKITLPRLGITIQEMRLYATASDIGHARLGKVSIKGIDWQPPATASAQTSPPFEDMRPLLATLDTYSSEIEIEEINLTPSPEMPSITGKGAIYDRGDRYQLNFTFATPAATAESLELAATASAEVFKQSGALRTQAEIQQLSFTLPDLTAKRVSGWVTFELPADTTAAPLIGAQVSAGSVRLYNIPLSETTLTVSGDSKALNALASARLPEKAGSKAGNGVQAEFSLVNDAAQRLQASLVAKLDDLDTLGIADVRGSATVNIEMQAEKDAAAPLNDLAAYRDISGDVNINARALSLGNYFAKANGTVSGKVKFDPDTKKMMFDNTAPVAITAQRDDGQWGMSAERLSVGYEGALASYHLLLEQAGITSPQFSLKDAQADITLLTGVAPVAAGKLSGTINSLHKPAYVVPLKFEATLNSLSSRQYATGFDVSVSGASGALMFKAQGSHDSMANKGDLRLRLVPLDMVEGVQALDEFFPVTEQYLSAVTGKLGALARLEWNKGTKGNWVVSQRGRLLLRDIAATYSGFPIVGINTVIAFDSLMPLTFARQQVAIGAFTAGLPLQNGLVTLSLDADNHLAVHDGKMDMAGGNITVAPFTFDLAKQNADIVLSAEKLDLKQIFAIAPLEGLSAEGRMQGRLPIAMREGNLTLNKGELSSIGGGVIRYSPRELPAFLADDTNQHIVDLRTALANFNFSSLKMGLQGDLLKEQTVTLNIEGNNPNFYGGHPVKLNLNVEGPLQNIVRYAPGNETIPDAIQKQFEQFEDANAAVAP